MPSESQAGQQAFGDIAPKLAQLSDNILFDDVWQRPELSPRERSLRNGVARQQLAELITHLAFYAGWPAAASAVARLRELEPEAPHAV